MIHTASWGDMFHDAANAIKSRGYGFATTKNSGEIGAAAVLWGSTVRIYEELVYSDLQTATRAAWLILWRICTGGRPIVTMEEAEKPTGESWIVCTAMALVSPMPQYRDEWKEVKLQYREVTASGAPLPDQPETPAETDAPPKKKAGGRRGRPPKNAAKTPETAPESTGGA